MIFFAAGDPGGSRVVLPLVYELARGGVDCAVLRHGYLGQETVLEPFIKFCEPDAALQVLSASQAMVFGSSVSDTFPLALARSAKEKGLPVIHVLDNWSSYAERLCTDGKSPLIPDLYLVMDEEARLACLEAGVPASCLQVTGHLGMAEVAERLQKIGPVERKEECFRLGLPCDKPILVFVSEPFSRTFGEDPQKNAGHPGFTERTVFAAFAKALQPWAADVHVALLAHPKQDINEVQRLWNEFSGGLQGGAIKPAQGRNILAVASGVGGMASILLYESWLMGLPTLALQPACRLPALQVLARRKGLLYTAKETELAEKTTEFLRKSLDRVPRMPHTDLALHQHAPRNAAQAILWLTGEDRWLLR